MNFIARPSAKIAGTLRVPGDKSISHRSIILGALADGVTTVTGFLQGEDSLATIKAFQNMGVVIKNVDNIITIYGVGLSGLIKPTNNIDVGNAGTGMRLLAGLLSGAKISATLIGDESLTTRPMLRIINPLTSMGANIKSTNKGTAPLEISPSELSGITYDMPIASAQVKSAVLLAGLYANGKTCVIEPEVTRDHTERMLRGFGYEVNTLDNKICVTGGGKLTAIDIDVPADISSAAFFLVAASISTGSDLTLKHVGVNPTRTGIIDILKLMGANIELSNLQDIGGEPVADIRVKSADLHGIDIPQELVPLAIDEFPVLFVAAAVASGVTRLTGAKELRVKESDRIAVMSDGLLKLGVDITPTDDGAIIVGGSSFSGGVVDSCGDHRIAMSFVVASLRSTQDITIIDCDNVNTSFPNFINHACEVGFNLVSKD